MQAKKIVKILDNMESYICQILLVFFVCLLFLQGLAATRKQQQKYRRE